MPTKRPTSTPAPAEDAQESNLSGVGDGLSKYRAKRSADATLEPFGGRPGADSTTDKPRLFVVQMHAARRLHWDLRLEIDGVLRSWAVPRGPSLDPAVKRLAVQTEDHPIEYLDFEGVIPRGNYGAGEMIVWDRGTWVPLEPVDEGYAAGKLLFELRGHKLRGVWTLVRTQGADGHQWLLIKKPDGAAIPGHDGEFEPASILSGLTVDELREGHDPHAALLETIADIDPPRRHVDVEQAGVMLARSDDEAFDDPEWVFEIKYDGYRVLAARDDDSVRLRYRSGRSTTDAYPEIVRSLAALPFRRFILDAEVVVLDDDARPNFARLQERAPLGRLRDIEAAMRLHPVTLYAFDILAFDAFDLRELPLVQRKALLKEMLPPTGVVRYADHIAERGLALMEQVLRIGVEGIVAKRANSPYVAGRTDQWRKIRIEHTADLVIVGFEPPSGNRLGFRSVNVGAYAGERLIHVGRVGGGFSDAELIALRNELDERVVGSCSVDEIGNLDGQDQICWVRPEIVIEVRYQNVTRDRMLRAPRFLRMRPDKGPNECTLPLPGERIPTITTSPQPQTFVEPAPAAAESEPEDDGNRRVVISNPRKIFWPNERYTKLDLVNYYRTVSPWLLPYLRDRPLVLTRYPDGIEGKSFFQKHAPPYTPKWVRTQVIWNEEEREEMEYFVVDDEDALAFVANMAAIPFHIRASRLSTVQQPDWCNLDLDPKTAPFPDVVRVAQHIHALCDEIGLPSYCKTSGSTGLHILVPLGAAFTFAQCKVFAELLARIVSAQLDGIATIERTLSKRRGRVYVDYGQNGHGRLLASPLCVRPLPGAPVSTPLRWEEVTSDLNPRAFTIATVPARLAAEGDPMASMLGQRPDLPAILERLLARIEAHP